MPRPILALVLPALLALIACSHSPRASFAGRGIEPAPVPAAPRPATTHDAYILLSGGGDPISNNYSQYLQARSIAGFFQRACPPGSTWVFFGAGNREGERPVLADVRREIKRDNRLVQTWLPGTLPHNRPATRESFLRALREEILPSVRSGGTLYLFVGDHGELAGPRDPRESAITLWQLKRGRRRASGWFTDRREILGVTELRRVLTEGLGEGRVVFCMTQCHSGGFHELGVASEMTPPDDWFAVPPASAKRVIPGLRLRAAGFTATDEASPAAGCDADPDPENWAGYERFLPESLFGIDLMTGASKGAAVRSLAEAHDLATRADFTIDKPRSSSEHYLAIWARRIESGLGPPANLAERTREAVAAFDRVLDTGRTIGGEPALQERQVQFDAFIRTLGTALPEAASLLSAGTRSQLEAAARRRERGGPRGARRGSIAELRRIWTEVLRPAWKRDVLAGRVSGLAGAALEFERHLLKLEDDGRNFLLPRGGDDAPLIDEVYWESGYADPGRLDPARADAIATWAAARRDRIIAWAGGSPDPAIRSAAEKIGPSPVATAEPPRPLSRRTAVERVLFYRRVLAAWQFLEAMDHRAALAELHTLIELERTPLPLQAKGEEQKAKS